MVYFYGLLKKLNEELFRGDAKADGLKWIGILDVFGFESFENNSFEQFCINFANERLQQFFNTYILSSEQDEYRIEAIFWTPIQVPDNQDVIDLVDGQPQGILAVLDSACRMPKGSDKDFTANLFQFHKKHARINKVERITSKDKTKKGFDLINGFSLRHYAGIVTYNAKEFLAKNQDSTHPDTVILFGASKSTVVREMIGVMNEADDDSKGQRKKATAFKSTGSTFSKQLSSLMTLLYQTSPYFVRCIKPNPVKKPGMFSWDYVRPQLQCGGIIEALRILKCGYPTRATYIKLHEVYGKILKPEPPNLNKRDFCEALLRVCGKGIIERSDFQLGLTKVFFRAGKQAFLEELLHAKTDLSPDTVKQIKRFLFNKRMQRVRASIRVHTVFAVRLRQMRALKRITRAGHVINYMAKTFFALLSRLRRKNSALALQASMVSYTAAKQFRAMKDGAVALKEFYFHNRLRRGLRASLTLRIQATRERKKKGTRRKRKRTKRNGEG